jgi:UDP-N-acetylmuramoyl-tripeptide--D-alanyl-D-alanine ligase
VTKKDLSKLYSEEISLLTTPEHAEYVHLNLRKIKEFRRNFNLPVIGIAGADGKTTTKGMLSAILSKRGKVLETPLDCSSTSTVSSTLLKLNNSYKFALVELGIINPQQFKLAVEIAGPNIGIITNVGEAHLANLGDKFILADAKVELIRQLSTDGFAVLNIDDELVSGMESYSPTQRVIKFGFNTSAHFSASDIKYLGPDGIEFTVNNYYKFNLPVYSSTSVSNALAAISAARILNFDFEEIISALRDNFQLEKGRGDLISLRDIFILNHTYNATINSVTKACESLIQFRKFSRNSILVLGDIENLGSDKKDIHLNLGFYLSALPIDTVITVGDHAKLVGEGILKINHNNKRIHHCTTVENIGETVLNMLTPHTTILMIGGKSLKLSNALKNLISLIGK